MPRFLSTLRDERSSKFMSPYAYLSIADLKRFLLFRVICRSVAGEDSWRHDLPRLSVGVGSIVIGK